MRTTFFAASVKAAMMRGVRVSREAIMFIMPLAASLHQSSPVRLYLCKSDRVVFFAGISVSQSPRS